VAEFQAEVDTGVHQVEVSTDGPLPRIRADREALSRALWNLLDNAVKYSPDAAAVRVEVAPAGDHVAIRVHDQGWGIPTAEQKEIFRKFVRGTAARAANVNGTGIGLALVEHIVRAHGGDIRLESQPGRGSMFALLLPAAEGSHESDAGG